MSGNGTLAAIGHLLGSIGERLRFELAHNTHELLAAAGVEVGGLEPDELTDLFDDVVDLVDDLVDSAEVLALAVDGGDALEIADAAVAMLGHLPTVISTVDDLSGLEPTADVGSIESIGQAIVDTVVIAEIEAAPVLAGGLEILGVIERTSIAETIDRAGYDSLSLRWDRLGTALTDPAGLLSDRVGWNDGPIDPVLFELVGHFLRRLGLPAAVDELDDGTVIGWLWILKCVLAPGASTVDVELLAGVNHDHDVTLHSGGWSLNLGAALTLTADASATIDPGSSFELVGAGADARLSVHAQLDRIAGPDDEFYLLAIPGVAGIRADALSLRAEVTVEAGTAGSLTVHPAVAGTVTGVRLEIDTDGIGGLLEALMSGDGAGPGSEIQIAYSVDNGLSFGGAAGVSVAFEPNWTVGPLSVARFGLDARLAPEGVDLTAAVDLLTVFGPFTARIDGIGVTMAVGFPNATNDWAFTVQPKLFDAIALAIQSEAVNGGGFLEVDHDIGRYSGAVSLQIVSVGIAAIVVVDTQLPDGSDGFAFFAALTIQFPGVPLGFGFSLTGVGGLVAINRAFDGEALAVGLRTGVVDSLLFPEDPINDAAEIIAQIDDYFPVAVGNTVIGPVVELAWGTPVLVTAQLGVVISMPQGVIAVLGSISARIPDPNAPALSLNLDLIGIIDIPAGDVLIAASLYDSRLLGVIELSGDMATYARFGSQPYFLFSVGGFHPAFTPPSNLPAIIYDLRRMTASISVADNVAISLQLYFAVTSNTVQFGAALELEASINVLIKTYVARGWFEFNVLLQFSPFKLVANIAAGVAIYSGNKELLGVHLEATVEGPDPWYVTGSASFRFFGLNVDFELEVGSRAVGEPRPTAEIRDSVLAALSAPSAWAELDAPSGAPSAIVFVDIADSVDADLDDDMVWVRPDRLLRVLQSIAPFDRRIEIVGEAIPAPGDDFFRVTAAGFGTVPLDEIVSAQDWFAPAHFEALDRQERLTRESFELMNGGVDFGAPEAHVTDESTDVVTVDCGYETDVYDGDASPVSASSGLGSVAESLRFTSTVAPERITEPQPTTFVAVATLDGAPIEVDGAVVTAGSQYEALAIVDAMLVEDPASASAIAVVPAPTAAEFDGAWR
ncbi:MAG: DUF6603 domain-containing protein [Actinomycetota bacterium]